MAWTCTLPRLKLQCINFAHKYVLWVLNWPATSEEVLSQLVERVWRYTYINSVHGQMLYQRPSP